MKKKLSIVLVTIISIISIFILAGCTPMTTNREHKPLVNTTDIYSFLEQFVVANPDRTAGDDTTYDSSKKYNNADRAGLWIAEQFLGMGYLAENDGMVGFKYENPFKNKRTETAYNVVFTKDNPNTDKSVVIGAHYDNTKTMVVGNTLVGGDGVYNNATGVIALLETAKALANVELQFDVTFVALSAEEIGHAGSKAFLKSLSQEKKDNTLLMVNYDSVTGGDYIYMYADEVKTLHYDYFYETSKSLDGYITDIPLNKRQITNSQLEGSDLMYYHRAMMGDNLMFIQQGINALSYISLNFHSRASSVVTEIKGMDNIIYTQADTLATMVERMGGGEKAKLAISSDIKAVVDNTITALSKQDFVDVMISSKVNRIDYSIMGNYNIMNYVGMGVTAVIFGSFVAIYFALKGKVKPHDVIIDTVYGRINVSRGGIPTHILSQKAQPIDPFGGEFSQSGQPSTTSTTIPGQDDPFDTSKAKDADEKDIFGEY